MERKIFLSFLILVAPVFCYGEDVKITGAHGDVQFRIGPNSTWEKAFKGTVVPEGGAVKTGEAGSALVEMSNKAKVWLKENTALEIEQKKSLLTRLGLVFGKIKVRVPHLMRREKFDLRTPTAVCAVRGTEFVMESDSEGKMNLRVLFGEVKMNYLVTPQRGDREVSLTQGEYLDIKEKDKPGTKGLMDKKQEIDGLQKWDPGLNPKQRVADLKRKEMDRGQIRDFADQSRKTQDNVASFISKGRESDIEAGRTLRDIHGNLVRVDQRLMRPDPSTLQFFNLVKRPVYDSPEYTNSIAETSGFRYNGGHVDNRLDMMVFTMNFDRDLPQSIGEWPGFFSKNDVNPNWSSFFFANKSSNDEIFFMGEGYRYDSQKDELYNDMRVVGLTGGNDVLLTGIIRNDSGINAFQGLSQMINLNIVDAGANSGNLKYHNTGNADYEGKLIGGTGGTVNWAVRTDAHYDVTGDPYLYEYQADKYLIGNKSAPVGTDYIWWAKENYVISNGGGIKKTKDFTNSSSDPFSILKESAGESISYIKVAQTTGLSFVDANGNWDDTAAHNDIGLADKYTGTVYTHGTNIDLVIIPDLVIAGIQKVLPAINNLNN